MAPVWENLIGKLFSQQVDTLLNKTGLDSQLKTLQVWPYLGNGQRGHQP